MTGASPWILHRVHLPSILECMETIVHPLPRYLNHVTTKARGVFFQTLMDKSEPKQVSRCGCVTHILYPRTVKGSRIEYFLHVRIMKSEKTRVHV